MGTGLIRLLLFWLMAGAGPLIAQTRQAEFEFRHIQEKDGLSSNLINCFLQDRDGFLWIGTFDGLNRYDGAKFVTFKQERTNPNSLLHNTVHDLCEDRQGNIWMAIENGVSCYEKATGRFRNVTAVNARALGSCNNILCDRDGDIWFTSASAGLYRYVTQTGQFQPFPYDPVDSSLKGGRRTPKNGLVQDPIRNGLWIGNVHGLHYFDIDHRQFSNYRHNPQQLSLFTNHYISALTVDGDRLIYADNTDKKIVLYNLSSQQVIKTITPVGSQPQRDVFDIATIFVDRQHNLWTSSWNYLMFHVAATTYRVTELRHDDARSTSVAGSFFWAGWQHPDGSVWLGTFNGISYTNPERIFYRVYDLGKLFPALNDRYGILSFLEDPDGTWWLGTAARGLLHYSPQTAQLQRYQLPNRTGESPLITSLNLFADKLYIGTERAVFVMDKTSKTFSSLSLPTYIPQHKVELYNLLLDGDRLWLFGTSKQTFCYHILTKQWQSYPIRSPADDGHFFVRKALRNRQGQLCLAIYPGGFARFLPEAKCFVVDEKSRNTQYDDVDITSYTEDQAGFFWLSSNGSGLFRYDPRHHQVKQWTESDGLAFDYCTAALPDQFDNIWVGAFNKFSVFTPAKNQFLTITLPYNLANLEYVNQLFPLRNKHILAALKGYLVEFFPEKLVNPSAKLPAKVLIGQLDVGKSQRLIHGDLPRVDLKADETNFAIHFGALTSETPFEYVYQLEGYDDWKRAGAATYAVYAKIPGGDYLFRVKGVTADGRETPIGTLAIHIDTLFYRTAWFWGLLSLLLVGLVVGFLRYRADQFAQLHSLQVQATRLERDKTEIQYQNLINHLNPHFLFNSLTSLNSLINTKPKEASIFLRKLSIIYRYILQNKDKDLVSLRDELTFAQNYIDLQTTRFGDDLQINIQVAPEYLTRQIVPVTIQNLLENAIKHNVLSEESPLHIQIYADDDALLVTNRLQKKEFVETSHKQGLASLKSLYRYLSPRGVRITETATQFTVAIPLL